MKNMLKCYCKNFVAFEMINFGGTVLRTVKGGEKKMDVVQMYSLNRGRETVQKKQIPENAQVLSVCVLHEQVEVAVQQDVNAYLHCDRYKTIEFAMFKPPLQFHVDDYKFLGTIILDYGNSIYHVFYREV